MKPYTSLTAGGLGHFVRVSSAELRLSQLDGVLSHVSSLTLTVAGSTKRAGQAQRAAGEE